MANVSQCDSCKFIGKHEDFVILKVHEEKSTGALSKIIETIELCPNCYKGVKEFLQLNGSE